MRLVILGTGTHVGKTYVTCRIAEGLRGRARVRALKPIETGVTPGEAGDAGLIAQAAGHQAALSPWRFAPPVSPHRAAREAGVTIEPAAVAAWITHAERSDTTSHVVSRGAGVTLIESAGGAFTPIAAGVSNAELASGFGPALWLLVAPDSLGVLHDVSAVLRALPRAPDHIILSSARPADASTGSNARELALLGIAEPLCVLGHGANDAEPVVSWLLAQAELGPG